MKLDLYNRENKKIGDLDISEDVILEEPNSGLVHQLLLLQHTRPFRKASTKTKGEVRGGGAKPWKQKGTGRARAGSIRSPLWRGGGVTFGPRPHVNSVDMPKRARLKALCSALTLKKEDLKIIDSFPQWTEPKTKEAVSFLKSFDATEKKVLLILDQNSEESKVICKSFSNLPKCRIIHWENLNVHDLFNAEFAITDQVIMKNIEAWLVTRKDRKGSKQEINA